MQVRSTGMLSVTNNQFCGKMVMYDRLGCCLSKVHHQLCFSAVELGTWRDRHENLIICIIGDLFNYSPLIYKSRPFHEICPFLAALQSTPVQICQPPSVAMHCWTIFAIRVYPKLMAYNPAVHVISLPLWTVVSWPRSNQHLQSCFGQDGQALAVHRVLKFIWE